VKHLGLISASIGDIFLKFKVRHHPCTRFKDLSLVAVDKQTRVRYKDNKCLCLNISASIIEILLKFHNSRHPRMHYKHRMYGCDW
jgi:hypothetical protein